jgi:hypothetical protein
MHKIRFTWDSLRNLSGMLVVSEEELESKTPKADRQPTYNAS